MSDSAKLDVYLHRHVPQVLVEPVVFVQLVGSHDLGDNGLHRSAEALGTECNEGSLPSAGLPQRTLSLPDTNQLPSSTRLSEHSRIIKCGTVLTGAMMTRSCGGAPNLV